MATLTVFILSAQTPMLLCLITACQCLILVLQIWKSVPDPWSVCIFGLVYVGGVLVLFFYVCSLAQEDKIMFNPVLLASFLPVGLALDSAMPSNQSLEISSLQPSAFILVGQSGFSLTLFLVSYLLLALVVVVKTCKFYKGALRQV